MPSLIRCIITIEVSLSSCILNKGVTNKIPYFFSLSKISIAKEIEGKKFLISGEQKSGVRKLGAETKISLTLSLSISSTAFFLCVSCFCQSLYSLVKIKKLTNIFNMDREAGWRNKVAQEALSCNFENWLLGVIRSWARQAREIFRLFVSYTEVKLHNRPRRFSMILHTHICNGLIDKT